jgi:Uma2 family endonuclease
MTEVTATVGAFVGGWNMAAIVKYRYGDKRSEQLHNGDFMSQKEFHRMYEQMPEDFRAELMDGIVFVKEPSSEEHGVSDLRVGTILDIYQARTPGVRAGHNVTVILGKQDEVQPDVALRILPAHGGQSKDTGRRTKKYILGAPELIVEIAFSSRAIDLHLKRERYVRAGVAEYIVVCIEPNNLYWLDIRNNEELRADSDGILRSRAFPGLWIHESGLLQLEFDPVMDALNEGLKSKEHAEFVKTLAAAQEQ